MEKRQLLFKPNIDEDDWLEQNKIQWSAFCHDALYKARNIKKQELLDRIGYRLLIILIGIALPVIGIGMLITPRLFFSIVLSLIGFTVIFIGVFSIIKEYRNAR